jgi:uncharacterized protein (TIGR02145 family)
LALGNNNFPLKFGVEREGTEFFNGKLDDIGIWNRALTPQEITNLYNAQVCQVSITTQPSNQTATSGQNIQFLTGSSELNSTFQWQSNSGSGFQDVVDGGQYSGSSTSTLSITGLTLQNNNQEFRCIVSAQNCGSDTSDVATLNVTNPNGLTGTLMYAHTPASPLVGVPVHLKSYLGYTAASDTTDSTGTYHLVGFPNGNYYLDADINYEVNGINSSDALLAQRFVIMLEVLSNLQQKSADVTGDQRIRTSDALMITRYTASLINQFPVGNFVNTRPDVTASGSVQSVNMLALASGDVNGNLLVQSSPPTLVLDTVYSSGTQGTATVRFTTSGSGIYERGVCWGTSPNPTIDSNKSVAGAGGFGFTHSFGGLTGGTQYHVRAYAINSAGTYYSNERSFTSVTWYRCPGTPSVTDIDGNVYNTVQIGSQCWTQSNLKVTKYRNGDNIPTGLTDAQWGSTSSGAYAIYNNDPVNDGLYGKLYNHYAVTDSRRLCPTGWYVPSDVEWTTLTTFLGGTSEVGSKMKSTDNQPTPGGWLSPNIGATNSSGFTGKPGGYRVFAGWYSNDGSYGKWWSSSVSNAGDSWYRYLVWNYEQVFVHSLGQHEGFSVRCLKNTIPQVNTTSVTIVTTSTALATGEVISEGDQNTSRGFCYSTTSNPTISNDTTMNGTGLGVYTGTLMNLTPLTTYYVRAYATNSVGTSYGSELNFTTDSLPGLRCPGTPTVTDIDGNIYNTVQIGNQCWTQSNLKVSKYRNGDTIPNFIGNTAWSQTNTSWTGAWCNYDNISANDALYGKLYNWYAVDDLRGICPSGWHVPSDAEWTTLENHLGGPSVAGGALTSTLTLPNTGGWASPNTGATNLSGFTALPGGLRSLGGIFDYVISNGAWWSTTEQSMSNVWRRNLQESYIWRYSDDKSSGFSVRCLKNTLPQVNTTSVTNVTPSTALVTGEVISEGDQNTIRGFCYSITSNPTISNDTTMNGIGLGVYSGTLQNLNPLTTYYLRAYARNSVGISYGNEVSFTTQAVLLPTLTTAVVSAISSTGASTGGHVTSDGGALVTARGVAFGTTQNPTTINSTTNNGTGTGVFTSTITGLAASTLYYVRAYATNSVGTAYGNQESFNTLAPAFSCGTSTVSDIDGNNYNTIQIGQQCWTQSNLRVGKYRNGNTITNITNSTTWSQANSSNIGAWCNYNNSITNGNIFGRLYNWYAVNDTRGLCPSGWHVPNDGEWTVLVNYLGGDSWAGGALKSTTILPTVGGWTSPNTSASNASGFTALPGGYRVTNGTFFEVGSYGGWWSTSSTGTNLAWVRLLWYGVANVDRVSYDQRFGFSVRCIRD